MKRQKRQRMLMAIMAGVMVAALLLPLVANLFVR